MDEVILSGKADLSAPTDYTMDDLGGAAPVKEWIDRAAHRRGRLALLLAHLARSGQRPQARA